MLCLWLPYLHSFSMPSTLPAIAPLKAVGGVDGGLGLGFEPPHAAAGGIQGYCHMGELHGHCSGIKKLLSSQEIPQLSPRSQAVLQPSVNSAAWNRQPCSYHACMF